MVLITQISQEYVCKILNWKDTIAAVQTAMLNVTEKRAIQNPRLVTKIPGTMNKLFTMPGYLNDEKYYALSCKLATSFPSNAKFNLPTTEATILLFNEVNGTLKAIIDGTDITLWRTAAASIIATKYMRSSKNKNGILAIIGAGAQAKIHAIAFQEIFNFNEVHIWNRNYEKAEKLCHDLNIQNDKCRTCFPFKTTEECVNGADVLITTTFSAVPLIKYEWLKKGIHINAVGHNTTMMELDEKTYKSSVVLVDNSDAIEHELKHLTDMGITFRGEVGALINGTLTLPNSDETTIFQNLGMAIEDSAMARLVYDKYMEMLDSAPENQSSCKKSY